MAVGVRLGVHFNPSLCASPIDPGLRTKQSSGWDIGKRGVGACHAGPGLNTSTRLAGKESSSALVDRAGGRVNAAALGGCGGGGGGGGNRDGQAGRAAGAASCLAGNGPVLAGTKVATRGGGGSRHSSPLDQLLRPQPVVPGQKEAAAALAPATTIGNGKGAGGKVDNVDDKKKGGNKGGGLFGFVRGSFMGWMGGGKAKEKPKEEKKAPVQEVELVQVTSEAHSVLSLRGDTVKSVPPSDIVSPDISTTTMELKQNSMIGMKENAVAAEVVPGTSPSSVPAVACGVAVPEMAGNQTETVKKKKATKKVTKKATKKQETTDSAGNVTSEYLQSIGGVIAPWEKESLLVVPPCSPATLLSLSSFGGYQSPTGEFNPVKKKQKPKKKKGTVVAAVCAADSSSPISSASVGGMGFSDSLSGANEQPEGGAIRQAATIGTAAVVSVSMGGGSGGLKGGDGTGGGGEGGGGGGGDNVPGSEGNSSPNAFVDEQEDEDGAPDGSAPHGPGNAYARRRGRPYAVKPLAYMGATTGPLGQTARVPPAVNLQEGVARSSTPVASAGTGGAGSGTGSAITSPRASAQSPMMGPYRAVGRILKGGSAPTSGPVAASTTDSGGSPVVMDWLASIVHSLGKRTSGLDWEKEKEKIVQAAGEEALKSLMLRSGDDALAARSEVSALRRLQREAFSDQLKTKDRIDKLEHFTGLRKVAHLGESMAGGGALASRTRMRGDIAVGAVYPLIDGSDEKVRQSRKLSFERVGVRVGVDARFTFETAFRGGKDTLITQCVSGMNGQAMGSKTVDGDAVVGPITVRKVVYSADLGDNLSLKFSPMGADGADICNSLNPLEGYGLTKSTAEGLPILKKCRGSAASATFKLNGASITTAQFIDRGATAFNGGNQRPSHATVAQVTLRPEEWLVVSLSGVSQFWAPPSNGDEAGTLRTPQWDDHVVQDDLLDGSITSKVSVQNADALPSAATPPRSGLRLPKISPVPGRAALQTMGAAAACDLGGNVTMASWAQVERAEWLSEKEKQHVRWGLTLSKAPGSVAGNGNGNGNGSSTGLGWGLSVGSNGMPETPSNSPLPRKLLETPLQMEGFLRIQCAKGFTMYPGVVCTTDGRRASTPGFVVRSHWSL